MRQPVVNRNLSADNSIRSSERSATHTDSRSMFTAFLTREGAPTSSSDSAPTISPPSLLSSLSLASPRRRYRSSKHPWATNALAISIPTAINSGVTAPMTPPTPRLDAFSPLASISANNAAASMEERHHVARSWTKEAMELRALEGESPRCPRMDSTIASSSPPPPPAPNDASPTVPSSSSPSWSTSNTSLNSLKHSKFPSLFPAVSALEPKTQPNHELGCVPPA
mmetsp:Transcript_7709/g.16709  ORF Transcript_7709/g.16709 Transcript_7709/m.16709 type:complete len:225 (-) Transcript_7709:188-862(-)